MDTAIQQLVEQAPWAAAMLGLTYMLLRAAATERAERIVNAKEANDRQRAHEVEINNMWANTVKNIIERQETTNRDIVTAIQTMHKDLSDQYEAMGITKDLFDMAKRVIAREGRSQ